MAEEEVERRVHPLRQAAVFAFAPLILMDTFLLIFTTTLLVLKLDPKTGPFVAGIVGAVYPGVNMIFELFWGWVADKYGRRPPLMIGGFFTIPALLGFVFATQPWHLLVAAAIRGVGGSAGVPLSKALAADLAPRKVFGERLGAWSMALYAAPLIGFAISGPLMEIWERLPFLLASITEMTCLLLAFFVIPETIIKKPLRKAKDAKGSSPTPLKTGGFRGETREFSKILRRRGIAVYSLALMMGFLGFTSVSTIAIPLFATKLGLSPTQISIIYVSGLLVPVMGLVPGGALSDKVGRKWPVILGGLYSALLWLLYVLVPSLAIPFLGIILIELVKSVGACISEPAFLAYAFEWVGTRERGRASAVTEFWRDFGTLIGLPLVGFLYWTYGPSYTFYYASLVGIIAYILVWVFWKNPPTPEQSGD